METQKNRLFHIFSKRITYIVLAVSEVVTKDRGSPSNVAIERGGIYEHETHGQVEVLGIWRGVQHVDKTGNPSESEGPMIVCYSLREGDQPIGELSDTLDSFFAAIEPTT